MPRLCYTLLFYVILPAVLLRLAYRALRAPEYRKRIPERFGFYAPGPQGCIWVHAVSVGESIAAAPLVRRLLASSDLPVLVTTMTPTGSARVRDLFGDQVMHVYAPYDLPDALGRFMRRFKPRLALIMETEIWPNTVAACVQQDVPVMLVNARLSEKSARGYRRARGLGREAIAGFSMIAAQSEADARRFAELGAPADCLQVTGSIKFDIQLDAALQAEAGAFLAKIGAQQRPVWIAASTHPGEEEILLDVHRDLLRQSPDLLLILVPRHPERFAPVAKLIERQGLSCRRKSELQAMDGESVLLGDTMGELLLLFGCADIAFVGGSLIERGGHNMLEPAAWGLPIVTGASDFNFAEISARLQEAGALVSCEGAEALAAQLHVWLSAPDRRRAAGDAARQVVADNRGALDRVLELVQQRLPQSS